MKKIMIGAASLLILSSLNVQGITLIGVADPLSGTNPTYTQSSTPLPDVGVRVAEASFGLGLTRLTEAGSLGSRHEYSRFDPYNKTQSMIILNGNGLSSVYETKTYPYNGVGNQRTQLSITEARWDRNDPDKIWGLSDLSIKTVNPITNTTTLIKDFSQETALSSILGSGARITMKDEGESSYDKRYWAFLVQDENYQSTHVFTWDKQEDKVLGTYELQGNETNIDWVGMSPKGNYVLVGGLNYQGTTENITGLTMATKELDRFHRLDYTTAHADVGLDSNGNEVVVMQNTRTDHIDLIPIDWDTEAITEIPTNNDGYEGTNRTKLVKLFYSDGSTDGFKGGVHISGNHDGYVLISTTIADNTDEQNWLDRSLIIVKLDPEDPEANFLAKIYNTTEEYWQETHGTISNDGTKVIWAANWDQVGSGGDFDNFILELDLAGTGIPSVTSVPIPAAFYLLGSALIGLFGISRRRDNEEPSST